NAPLRNRTRRLPWRSIFQLQCLGSPLRIRARVPRIWRLSVPSGVLGEDANGAIRRDFNAANFDARAFGAADQLLHVVLAKQAATTNAFRGGHLQKNSCLLAFLPRFRAACKNTPANSAIYQSPKRRRPRKGPRCRTFCGAEMQGSPFCSK